MEINCIILDSAWQESDQRALFEFEEVVFESARDLPNLLVKLGVFPSTSMARRAGRTGPIPEGLTHIKASKKVDLWVWNPISG